MAKQHPHTTAVAIAGDTMTKVIKTFGAEPKFMGMAQERPVHPEVARLKGKVPTAMYERLSRMND